MTADTYETVTAQDAAPAAGDQRTGSIVVGIDGSGCALHAARWAADEASRHSPAPSADLFMVPLAARRRTPRLKLLPRPRTRQPARLRHHALRGAMNTLRRAHPSLTVTCRLAYGNPGEVLRERCLNAMPTVIGAHRSDDHSMEGS